MIDKKKKFRIPEATVIDFYDEDIITASALTYDAGDAEAGWNEQGAYDNW